MQSKKKISGLLPILLILVFVFLLLRANFFKKSEATLGVSASAGATEAPRPTLSGQSGTTDGDGSLNVPSLPLDTQSGEGEGAAKAPAATLPSPETSEDSVDAMAPQAPYLPLVTEFKDAFQVLSPSAPSSEAGSTTKVPALVTGFSDTLPLALPITSPNVDESREEMRAVYVASVYNLDFPSRAGLSAASLRAELDAIVERTAALGLNTIFFQVRPASDALYASDIFPVSRFLAESEGGALAVDPLAYLIERAHKRGIDVHAWINPFRVTLSGESLSSLSAENPARQHPSLTLSVSGNYYYNPSLDEVHALIAGGVYELVARYDIDGILFDDYFYPSDVGLADESDYLAYRSAGGRLSLSDWRRDNINRLVERVYRTVKSCRSHCLFGISPRGIWRNAQDDPSGSDTLGGAAYDEIYCDALAWVKGGYIDYLSPQIYWSFESAAAPFAILADWWNSALKGSGVRLTVSLASYSLSPSEIDRQKAYLADLSEYGGFALYRFASLGS